MTAQRPVTYLELGTPDLDRCRAFFREVFGWDPQPFAADDNLVAPRPADAGIDTALLTSRDGQPRAVPVINTDSLESTITLATENGATLVVEPFTIPGVGRGCYLIEPTGLLIGLHQNDPSV